MSIPDNLPRWVKPWDPLSPPEEELKKGANQNGERTSMQFKTQEYM